VFRRLIALQCVYSSEEELCDFCRERGFRNCLKVWANEYSGGRLTTAVYYKIEEMERETEKSLAENNLNPKTGFLPIFQKLSTEPTGFMPKALRYAVLAWQSRRLNAREFVEKAVGSFMARACRYLDWAFQYTGEPSLAAFTTLLLGWLAYSTCAQEVAPPKHFTGSLNFLTACVDEAQALNKSLSESLTTYGPFIIDCANAWESRHGRIPVRLTQFSQRVNYFNELHDDNPDEWHLGILEAANSTLGNLMEVALTWVYNIALREVEFNFSRDNVPDVLQYIRSELGDVDLHASLKTLNASFQGAQTNHSTVEGQLITRIFHRLRCILLLLTLLESESIGLGTITPKAKFIATSTIRYCRSQAIRRDGPIEDYYLISWHNFSHLLLGGIALPIQESEERKAPLLMDG
jgi:hypothetical protein